jgi:molybdate transport system substrate-binding protein
MIVGVALLAVACGGGGDDDEAETPDTSPPDRFVIWAPEDIGSEVEDIVNLFRQRKPEIDVEVVIEPALDLNDRLLLGERPDAYVGTARRVNTLIDEGSLPDNAVDLGSDVMQIVVAPGNPKAIVDLEVFGIDPATISGVCSQDTTCGKGARNVLSNARIAATPDSTEPDAKALRERVANGRIDAGLLFRTQTARAVRKGEVSTVDIPTAVGIETVYRLVVVRPGEATDAFVRYLGRSSSVKKVLQNTGLAPVPPAAP